MKTTMRLDTKEDLEHLAVVAGEVPAMAAGLVAVGVDRMRSTMGVDTGQLKNRTGITAVNVSGDRVTVDFTADTPYAEYHDNDSHYWAQGLQDMFAAIAGVQAQLTQAAPMISDGTFNPRKKGWTPIDPATVTIR